MRRWYLSMRNTVIDAIDDEGLLLVDLEAAKDVALRSIREFLAAEVLAGNPVNLHGCIEITDEDGNLVHTVPFSDGLMILSN